MEGQANRLEGSNAGVGGGVGPVELFMGALWIGVVVGLGAEGPVLGGVEVSPGSSPARWRNSANWFLSWVISCWVSGSVVRAGTQLWMMSAICWAANLVLLGLSSNFPSCLARLCETRSRSTPRLLSCVKSSVMKTTVAISPVGIG